jgi:hypothetical protein
MSNGTTEPNDGTKQTTIATNYVDDYTSDGIAERFVSVNFMAMTCNREEIFFYFFLFCVFVFFIFSSFSSSSKVVTRATHYMIASSKTHRSAQPKC